MNIIYEYVILIFNYYFLKWLDDFGKPYEKFNKTIITLIVIIVLNQRGTTEKISILFV